MDRYYIEWYPRYAGWVIRNSSDLKLLWRDLTPLLFFSRSQAAEYLKTLEVGE